MGEGEVLYSCADASRLGRRFAQKFAPRRDIEEEMFHGDHSAYRCTGRPLGHDLCPFDAHLRAELLGHMARGQRDPADGGDAVERFPPKTEGRDPAQILCDGQLAGGVALKGQRHLCGWDAAAIVRDAQQSLSALANLDTDFGSAGIDAVFDQFLGYIGRPFHNLAGSNLGGNVG